MLRWLPLTLLLLIASGAGFAAQKYKPPPKPTPCEVQCNAVMGHCGETCNLAAEGTDQTSLKKVGKCLFQCGKAKGPCVAACEGKKKK
jgi:hypothetical protein